MSRDSDVREVTALLESLLDRLNANVAALNAILAPAAVNSMPEAPPEEVSR